MNASSLLRLFLGLSLALTVAVRAQEKPAPAKPAASPAEVTPASFPDAETFVYRDGQPEPMRLFVVKPAGWKPGAKLPALIWFFGGGWTKGSPEKSIFYARNAARWGMVGIAPDYRTKNRFGTSPLESVADGRAALRWVEDHAEELGIDPARIVVGGGSAGGHVALWTAIEKTPPGSNPDEAPKTKPIGLLLMCPVSDTSKARGYTPQRFGDNAEALSPYLQLDAKMPPVLLLHGDADKTVPYTQSVDLAKKLQDTGNSVEFVTVPGGSHGFISETPGWRDKSKELILAFLKKQNPTTAQ
jgi:acetyl esterase